MKKIPFIAVWFILIGCFFALNLNNQARFEELTGIEGKAGKYQNKSAVNLDNMLEAKDLSRILEINNYVNNKEDADYVARFIVDKMKTNKAPNALFELKKRIWQIPADTIEMNANVPESFKQRLADIRMTAGWSDEVDSMYRRTDIPSIVNTNHGGKTKMMKVVVKDQIPDSLIGFTDKIMGNKFNMSEGVIVRLQKYVKVDDKNVVAIPLAYARTDANGEAYFAGLCADSSYSVLPIRKNMSYGSEKGTYLGNWGEQVKEEETEYSFVSFPLSVRLFQNQKLTNMRDDGVVTVRTPDSFNRLLTFYMIVFLTIWLVIFFVGNSGKRRMDNLLAAGIMLVSGLSMLFMFGINDPLTENVLGYEMAQGSIIGAVIVLLLLLVDMKKFFQNRYWVKFDIFLWIMKGLSTFVGWVVWLLNFLGLARIIRFMGLDRIKRLWHEKCQTSGACRNTDNALVWIGKATSKTVDWCKQLNGIGYLLGAIFLSVLLMLFGQEVGGMKVNLNLGIVFQPSEIIKYMFVVFMAAFFFEKGNSIIAYSEADFTEGAPFWKNILRRIKSMCAMLAGLLILMAFYIKNSDMGPALVVSLTFIVLYSLLKSRFVFDESTGETPLKQFIHSDLCMLIIGVLTYMVALVLGNKLYGETGMSMFTFLWLAGWFLYGRMAGNRFYETPIMFNALIFFFVLGGSLFETMGFDSIAERLMQRNSMCTNTWGDLNGEPGINTQVAEGLWGLASGGFTGQGLGNAQAHYIPAFHTDMVLQSIGEIMGFFGIIGVLLLLSLLLRRTILAGYQSGHQFLMLLCCGIAIISGIQLFIITFGSLGVIPLTGISVPFFSYGRVSLILNLMAFGIVLAVSAYNPKAQATNMRPYNLTVGLLSIAYSVLTVFAMAVIAHYQIGPERDKTLIRELFVYDTSGAAVVKYNPRISYLTSKMKAGNIYDRNGLLLATSDPDKLIKEMGKNEKFKELVGNGMDLLSHKVQKRYYPFGEHLFFMVGDMNNRFYFSSVDEQPFGYLAEARFMSEMRGYENRKFNDKEEADKKDLISSKRKLHRFLPAVTDTIDGFQLRDYTKLLDFLKQGINSKLLDDYNNGRKTYIETNLKLDKDDTAKYVMPRDIQLTIDAELQMKLQNRIPEFAGDPKKFGIRNEGYRRFERYSIVVLDAVNGDLLASANYPLPDYDRIEESNGNYSDNNPSADFTAFTERDLGLTFYTNPGSTAKVMSSLAGLMHMDSIGRKITKEGKNRYKGDYTYKVYSEERIHNVKYPEPPEEGPMANVNLFTAIDKSSNCYFVNLVNDLDLYNELAKVYGRAGHRIGYKNEKGNTVFKYPFKFMADDEIPDDFINKVIEPAATATLKYRRYIDQRDKGGKKLRMISDNYGSDAWMWSWGEGTLEATPEGMARVAAAAATGKMPRPRYRLDKDPIITDEIVKNKENLIELQDGMRDDAATRYEVNFIAGKTGTPERTQTSDYLRLLNYEQAKNKKESLEETSPTRNVKDGWYIAYIEKASTPGEEGKPGIIAVAVRIERTIEGGSGNARNMFQHVALPVLSEMGYIPKVGK